MLVAILRAQAVNHAVGGLMITPWEVGEIPGDWMEAFVGLSVRMPEMQRAFARVEAAKNRIKAGRKR